MPQPRATAPSGRSKRVRDRAGRKLARARGGSLTEDHPDTEILTPDAASFREVLGHFATGITVITAMDGDEPVGLAANSFTSVSLDPPLVLFCAAKSSSTWPRIQRAGHFTVNVLDEHQEEVSRVPAACAKFPI